MGEPARNLQSISFEGTDIERLRVALQAVNTSAPRMLKLSDRGVMYVEFEVERIEHYGTPCTRRHILKPIEARID